MCGLASGAAASFKFHASGRPHLSAPHAHRAIAFFREFQGEDGGIHQASSPTYNRGARSYYGKPTDTREMIGQLYEAHRKGPYVGREAEWARQEADIFAAQREGRVAGVYLTK